MGQLLAWSHYVCIGWESGAFSNTSVCTLNLLVAATRQEQEQRQEQRQQQQQQQPKDMYSSSMLHLKGAGLQDGTLHNQTDPFLVNESRSDKPAHQPCEKPDNRKLTLLWMYTPANEHSNGELDFFPPVLKSIEHVSDCSTIAMLGGGFKHFLFSPLLGEMIHFD